MLHTSFTEFCFEIELKKELSYDVASGSEITPCIEINKPLVVYRFLENIFTPKNGI